MKSLTLAECHYIFRTSKKRYTIVKPLFELWSDYEVFEVIDEHDQSKRILKVLATSQSNLVEIFKREADILSQIKHPGIPKLEEDFTLELPHSRGTKQLHCRVMELVAGQNLEQWLAENEQLPQKSALDWLQQLLEILALVHEKGEEHRDIKPENIMLKPDGRLVLIDFGVVKEITRTYLQQTVQGQQATSVGTDGYTPPEQINGKPVLESDFFGLGRTFVHLLTGKHPDYLVDSEDSQTGRLNWRTFAPQVTSKRLAELLEHLIAPEPKQRPENIQVIWERLASIHVETDEALQAIESQMRATLLGLPAPIKFWVEQKIRRELLILAKKKARVPVIALYGRTQSGKSSLVNAILNKRDAEIGGLGESVTKTHNSYEHEGNGYKLRFVDTRGVGESADEEAETQALDYIVAAGVDILLFVVAAADPGYVHQDVKFLTKLKAAHAQKHGIELQVILVLNKIDQIKPEREWTKGSYDFNLDSATATTVKEANIRKCIRERINNYKTLTHNYVPICALWDEYADERDNIEELLLRIYDCLPEAAKQGFVGATGIESVKQAVANEFKQLAILTVSMVSCIPVPMAEQGLVLWIQVNLVRQIAELAVNSDSSKTASTFFKDLGIQTMGIGGGVGIFASALKSISPLAMIPTAMSLSAATWTLGDAAIDYFIKGDPIEVVKKNFEQEKERQKLKISAAIKGEQSKLEKTWLAQIISAVSGLMQALAKNNHQGRD